MIKKIVLMIGSIGLLVAATPQQVERYLLISGSEDQLIQFEQMVDQMGQMFARKGGSDVPLMQDSQMLPIRFREYIQRNLSENEMTEVLANYRHDVLRKLVNAEVLMEEPDTLEAYRQFQKEIKSDLLSGSRTETIKGIIKKLYDEKMLIDFFNKMFLPMVKQMSGSSGKKMDDKMVEQLGKKFVSQMRKSNYNAMLYMTRDFTDDELQELDDLSGNSATSHETRAVFGAIVYAMEEVMNNMAERFKTMLKYRKHPRMVPQGEGNVSQKPKQ